MIARRPRTEARVKVPSAAPQFSVKRGSEALFYGDDVDIRMLVQYGHADPRSSFLENHAHGTLADAQFLDPKLWKGIRERGSPENDPRRRRLNL